MRVQTRLLLLMAVLVAAFIGGLSLVRYRQQVNLDAMLQDRQVETHRFFDSLLDLSGRPLNAFSYDYSFWDDMVEFVRSRDEGWAQENIDAACPTFGAHAAWVYDPDFQLVYFHTSLPDAGFREEIPPPQIRGSIFREKRLVHFFLRIPAGMMEVRGATIHPTSDPERKTPPQGSFFVARLLDEAFLQEMSSLARGSVSLSYVSEHPAAIENPGVVQACTTFDHELRGYQGDLVGILHGEIPAPFIQQAIRSANWQFLTGAGFCLLLLFSIAIAQRVAMPLRRVAAALETGNPVAVYNLQKSPTEFGHIARMLNEFYRQKDNLVAEIAERKCIEEHLRSSEENFRTLMNATTDWVFLTDTKGGILAANEAFAAELATTVSGLLGQNVLELATAEHLKIDKHQLLDVTVSRKPAHFETEKFGRSFEISMHPVIDPEGNVARIAFHVHDISERKRVARQTAQLEDELRQAQKIESIGQLTGGIAHDFNNLLAPIIGYAEMAQKELETEHPLQNGLRRITEAAERAKDLIRQLLAFSRKQVLDVHVLNLNTAITEFEGILQRMIGEEVHVDVRLKPGLGSIQADRSQIQQIIINLAVNARDAMPQGGRLIIETADVRVEESAAEACPVSDAPPGDYVLMTVSDTGCGMSTEVKKHLFEPFFTTKEQGKGTGLGLATVYGIVKQHGGHIAVHSEPGQGTAFYVYFPRIDGGREDVTAKIVAPSPVRGTETILLVEDAEMVRKLTRDILTANGYTVFSMANVTETLDWAQQYYGAIHLLLTDVVMPEMNGKELFMQLAPFRPEMKCLFMSGYTADVIVHHGMLEQGVHFLQKPFSVSGLLQKVREVLDT